MAGRLRDLSHHRPSARPLAVVALVLRAKDVLVERRPGLLRRDVAAGLEGMAGGADGHQGLARRHVGPQQRHHAGRRGPTSHAHHHQVGGAQRLPVLEVAVPLLLRRANLVDLEAAQAQVLARKCRQRLPRAVLVLPQDQRDPPRSLAPESERLAPEDVRARRAWAPELLDVLHHERRSAEVRHVRGLAVVVHRVGHVAHQHHVLALPHHLTDRERPPQDTHVDVHPHHQDVRDPALPHQVVGLRRVRDGVAVPDLDGRMLPRPRLERRAIRAAVAAAVRVVDRQRPLHLRLQRAPTLQWNPRVHLGHRPCQRSPRVVLVEVHRVARAMNHEASLGPQRADQFVHARGHLSHPLGRVRTMMLVPHVAHDHRRARGIPGLGRLAHGPVRLPSSPSDPVARLQQERALGLQQRRPCAHDAHP